MNTPEKPEPVATGDRRDEIRFERDPDQLVRMRATFRPDEPPPPEMVPDSEVREPSAGVEDVAVTPDAPSAWDARPADPSQKTPKA